MARQGVTTGILTLVAMIWASVVAAQGLFSPVIRVNDRAVTAFELEQRAMFLRFVRAPGNIDELARDQLIDDRLRRDAAALLGISVPEEDILLAIDEFAARAQLSGEALLAEMARAGIDEGAFRDFVVSGVLWREVVRARFGPRTQVTEAEVDRALALSSQRGGARVLLSEIVLPATPEFKAQSEALALEITEITSFERFASAARQFSAAPTRNRGGRIDWLPIGNLPPQIRGEVLTMAPGQVTDPVRLDNAIALFQLRAVEDVDLPADEAIALEYARFLHSGGAAEAARIRAEVDTCDDLYGLAQGLPEDRLLREVLPVEEVPTEIALELAKLDEGESSTALGEGVFLMLCGRTSALSEDVSREQIRSQLSNQRLASYADSYLAELRAEAHIVYEDPSLRP